MNFLALSIADRDMTSAILWLAAWFVTIGLHEGAHAWVAYWLGDDTAYQLGKRSLNPLRHIDFHDRRNLIATVIIPVITVFTMGWPLGMAWVPVNPSNFRHPTRDMALTSAAGPGGNVIGTIVGLIIMSLSILLGAEFLRDSIIVFHRTSSIGLDLLANFGLRMMALNILLGTINLIPVPGVDGGSILYHFLNRKGRQMFDQLRPYGFMIFILLAWTILSRPIGALFFFSAVTIPEWLKGIIA